MNGVKSDVAESAWRRRAGATALRINAGWWMERFAPLAVATSILAFCVILFIRSRGTEPSPAEVVIGLGLSFAAAGIGALLAARRSFCTIEDAMVRLESRLGLHNALTAAAHGTRPWPEVPASAPDDGIRWRWPWIAVPILSAMGAIAAALLVPVSVESDAAVDQVREPSAWGQVESMLEVLDEEDVVQDESLEKIQERIDELRAQPKEEWYSHSSMEASDHERARLENTIEEMAANLDNAARALSALEKFDEQITGAARERLLADFGESLEGLDASDLAIDPKLMESLANLDPSQLKAIDPETLKKLIEKLKQAAGTCKQCSGNGDELAWGDLSDAEFLALINGMCSGSMPGSMPGRGGISRGPGTAPISLADEESNLGTNNLEAVQAPDPSNALPADLLGLSQGEHELDKAATAPQSGGAISSPGRGGETVWKESLLPSEKKVLERYFD